MLVGFIDSYKGFSAICKRAVLFLLIASTVITDQSFAFLLSYPNFLVPFASQNSHASRTSKPIFITFDENNSAFREYYHSDSRSDNKRDDKLTNILPTEFEPLKRIHGLSLLKRSDDNSDSDVAVYEPNSESRAKRVHGLSLLRGKSLSGSNGIRQFEIMSDHDDDATRAKRMHHLSRLRKVGVGNKLFRIVDDSDSIAESEVKRKRPVLMLEL